MPIYISRGRFTAQAMQGMMANPEDREASVSKLFEAAGGKLLAYYVTLGEDDWLLISDCPDEKALSAAMIAASAAGSVSNIRSTVAMTSKQAMEAFKAAQTAGKNFKSAGR